MNDMAGHSKWANIKYRKDKADRQKGKLFSRVAKEIISAVKLGGADPKSNPRLRLAVQRARDVNMPNENVERNIKKASSPDQADFASFTYELYGYGGVGILAVGMTDNKNRLASEMRIATNKRGGTIAAPGAVAFNFDKKGVLQIEVVADGDALFQAVVEAGAEDFESGEGGSVALTDPQELYAVKEKLEALGYRVKEAELEMVARAQVSCNEEDRASNLALIEWLEGLEDVDSVYHNMELT